jgi:hypothetical protein
LQNTQLVAGSVHPALNNSALTDCVSVPSVAAKTCLARSRLVFIQTDPLPNVYFFPMLITTVHYKTILKPAAKPGMQTSPKDITITCTGENLVKKHLLPTGDCTKGINFKIHAIKTINTSFDNCLNPFSGQGFFAR